MSTAVQPAFTAEFAATHRDMLLGRIEKELATTKRVIGNIPNDKRDYKPHPVSRSAWELANHLALSDIWFLNGVASCNFDFTGEPPAPAATVAVAPRRGTHPGRGGMGLLGAPRCARNRYK